jgi:anti-sigma factor RsiW
MTCDSARAQLQEQIDGSLDATAARELARHVETCASCRGLAADLASILDAAEALQPIEPPDHVWLQIAGRWRREHPEAARLTPIREAARKPSFTLWYALAAAAMLAVASAAWRATGAAPGSGAAPVAEGVLLPRVAQASAGNANSDSLVESAKADLEDAERLYRGAIASLEQAAASHRELLAPEVAAALDRNLEVIDEAIGESRAAVKAQPDSVVARESLFEALRKKVTLLQNTISLVTEISRGNQAGVSRVPGT